LAAACNGAGACPALATKPCGEYVCSGTACRGNCNSDADCISGDHCSAKVCSKKKDPGATCGDDAECKSGHCVDKVCCDQACDRQCQACDVPTKVGTCSPVAGAPHGGRTPCASDHVSNCGGECDGKQISACAYPGDGVICNAPRVLQRWRELSAGANPGLRLGLHVRRDGNALQRRLPRR
jgi:hypothetical protein